MARSVFYALFTLFLLTSSLVEAEEPNLWVEAEGFGQITSKTDQTVARRRAMADALLAATLSGGAHLRGHTVLDQGVITADRAIMRPMGRVLRFSVQREFVERSFYRVRIRALVGAVPKGACSVTRILSVTGVPTDIRIAPRAPAWAHELGQELSRDIFRALEDHSHVRVMQITRAKSVKRAASRGYEFDYDAVTRGVANLGRGDHVFRPSIDIRVDRAPGRAQTLHLGVRLVLEDGEGQSVTHRVESETTWARSSTMAALTRLSRNTAREELFRDVMQGIRAVIDGQICMPPNAVARVDGDQIIVPIGSRHGLTQASLGFVVSMQQHPALLEIQSLGATHAVLRPLDPSIKPGRFAGRRLQFWETGL